MNYYNRFGQFVFSEPRGRSAGYEWPHCRCIRGDFHQVLVDAVRERIGPDAITINHQCAGVAQDDDGVTAHFIDSTPDSRCRRCVARAVIGCDGFHSVIRRQLHPNEGPWPTRASICGAG